MDFPYHKFARFFYVVGTYDPKIYGTSYIITNANIWMERTCCPQDLRPDANPFKYFAAKFVYTVDHKYFFNVRYWRCCYDAAAFCNKFESGKSLRLRGGFLPIQCFKVEKRISLQVSVSVPVVSRTFIVFRVLFCQNGCKTFAQLFGLSYSDSRAQPSLGPLNINVHITHISLTFLTRKCRK